MVILIIKNTRFILRESDLSMKLNERHANRGKKMDKRTDTGRETQ